MEVTYIESNKTWVISYDKFNNQDNVDKLAKQLEQFGCKRVVTVPARFSVIKKQPKWIFNLARTCPTPDQGIGLRPHEMVDLVNCDKKPLHITRETMFDNESIPDAAISLNFRRYTKRLETKLAIANESIQELDEVLHEMVEMHQGELSAYRAHKTAQEAVAAVERTKKITSGTIDAKEIKIENLGSGNRGVHPERGHAPSSVPPHNKKMQIEIKVDAEQFKKGLKELKELLKCIDDQATSSLEIWGNDKPEMVIPLNGEVLGRLGKKIIPTVYNSQIAPINPHNGDLWYYTKVSDLGNGTSEVSIFLNRWNGRMWELINPNNDHA